MEEEQEEKENERERERVSERLPDCLLSIYSRVFACQFESLGE